MLKGLDMTSTDEFNLEKIRHIISMQKAPADEALYLFDLYELEALEIAEGCWAAFEDGSRESKYWKTVCDCLKPLMTKH